MTDISMTLEEYAAADLAIEEAERGDFTLLAERLRNATVLLPTERVLAAGIITGKLRRPRHRLDNPGTQTRNWLLAFNVATLMNNRTDEMAAVLETMAANGVCESTVRKAVQAFPELRVIKSPA